MAVMARDRKHIKVPTPKQIVALREKLGITQAEAAERVAVAQGIWSKWETGERKPSQQSALLLKLLAEGKI